jgi:hypothetical protein
MRKRGYTKFLLFLMVAGACLMVVGRVMGAQTTVAVDMFGRRMDVSALNFGLHRAGSVINTASDGAWDFVNSDGLAAFRDIDIKLIDMDVELRRGDAFIIEMEYPDDRDIQWEIRNGRLTIEDKTNSASNRISLFRGSVITFRGGGKAVIYSPGTDMGNIELINVSGNIEIFDYNANLFNLESISGSINGSGLSSPRIRTGNVSGSTELYNLRSNDIRVESVSGGITLFDNISRNTQLTSVSGNIHFESTESVDAFEINLKSISGALSVNDERVSRGSYSRSAGGSNKINAETVSGNINLFLGL